MGLLSRFIAIATADGGHETGSFIARSTWTLIEANTGIVCACLPLLKQPLTLLFPHLFRSGTSASGKRSAGLTLDLYELHSNPAKQVYAYPNGTATSTKVTAGYHEKGKSSSQTDGSEEDILPPQGGQPSGITRKTDFTIAYEQDGAESVSSLPDEHSPEAQV